MLKTVIILPSGTELSSGTEGANAIKNVSVTACVNDGQELSLGSVCANMIELTAITPNGGLSVAAADELQVYYEDSAGARYPVGIFVAEKPVRQTANTLRVTAFDRVCLLDQDLTDWFNGLQEWPYTLLQLSRMICEVCGLEFANTQIPNGECAIDRFEVNAVTGRKLLQWAAEAAGRFCRATVDGKLEFAWYSPSAVPVAGTASPYAVVTWNDTGDVALDGTITTALDSNGGLTLYCADMTAECTDAAQLQLSLPMSSFQLEYFQDGLKYEDYSVAPIQKVCIDSGQQIPTVWPADLAEAVNTYTVSGNGFLMAASENIRQNIAKALYETLENVTYTPCKIVIPTTQSLRAGDIVTVTDRNGRSFTTYVMTKKQTGQKETLECTGSARRDSSTAINALTLRDISGKVANIKMTVDGLQAEAKISAEQTAALSLLAQSIRSEVTCQQADIDGVKKQISSLEESADALKLSFETVTENGVSQVQTKTGYTFNEEGLIIAKDGTEIVNTLDETGMYVNRNGEVVLQANNSGVTAVDVTVGNYLIVGGHARFEDFSRGTDLSRTACFWI